MARTTFTILLYGWAASMALLVLLGVGIRRQRAHLKFQLKGVTEPEPEPETAASGTLPDETSTGKTADLLM